MASHGGRHTWWPTNRPPLALVPTSCSRHGNLLWSVRLDFRLLGRHPMIRTSPLVLQPISLKLNRQQLTYEASTLSTAFAVRCPLSPFRASAWSVIAVDGKQGQRGNGATQSSFANPLRDSYGTAVTANRRWGPIFQIPAELGKRIKIRGESWIMESDNL